MNLELWIAVIAMVATAFAIIFPPLLRKLELPESDVAEQNIAIARQKMHELKQQLAESVIDQEQFDQQLLELETALEDDISLSKKHRGDVTNGRWVVYILTVSIPALLLAMYFTFGAPESLNYQEKQLASKDEQQQKLASVDIMLAKLEQRMQETPDDVQGWIMLGRSYKFMNRYADAVQAYGKAYALAGEEPDLMLQYADALVMSNNGKFTEQSQQLIYGALQKAPENTTALWLAGIAKAESGHLLESIQILSKAQAKFSIGSDSYAELDNYIKSVKKALPDDEREQLQTLSGTRQEVAANDKQQLIVSVELSDILRQKANPSDTLFIYAKATSGPQMPLAIVKKQMQDLPLEIRLTDAQAMTPTMKLSNFSHVHVFARISKSGQAIKQTGDLIGSAQNVSVSSAKTISVLIDQVVN